MNGKWINSVRAIQFYAKPLALDLGLLRGHSNYQRFIILGRGRTGSNFLRGLLNAHSQIVSFGELFRFYDDIGWEFPEHERYLKSRRLLLLSQRSPCRFLERNVFRKFPDHILAVGFKIFYYHAQEDTRKPVWTYLRNQKGLKIIHIKRKNTLRMLLSNEKAFKTNRWTNTAGVKEGKISVYLDYKYCLETFKREDIAKQQYDSYFAGKQMIEVIYEDLCNNYQGELKRIQEVLGVDYEDVKPSTYKQAGQPLSAEIANYFILKEKFINTPWERFFED